MKYRILSKAAPPEASQLTLISQPVTERGAVTRGSVALTVRPGLLAARLAGAIDVGEVWELRLAADGQTILEASYRPEEQRA